MAKVRDPAASDFPEPRERGRVRACIEDPVDPIPAAFQGRALVGRAEEDEVAQRAEPLVARDRCVGAGAARHQPAHAVADDRELLDRHRPGFQQRLEHLGERAPIGGDVATAVVVQVDLRHRARRGRIPRQRCAMVVPLALPLQVVETQAVHQHQHSWGRICDRPG